MFVILGHTSKTNTLQKPDNQQNKYSAYFSYDSISMKVFEKSYQQKIILNYQLGEVLIQQGVMEIFFKEFITINEQDLKQFIKQLRKDIEYCNRFKVITHIDVSTKFTEPARSFFLKTLSSKFKVAECVVTENISQQFILEALTDKIELTIPFKIVNKREEAIEWIKTINLN